jgi:hypothetical protein
MSDEGKFIRLAASISELAQASRCNMEAAPVNSTNYFTAMGAYQAASVLMDAVAHIQGGDAVNAQFDAILTVNRRVLEHLNALINLYANFWAFYLASADPARHNNATIPALALINANLQALISIIPEPTPEGTARFEQGMKDIQAYLDQIKTSIEHDHPPTTRPMH